MELFESNAFVKEINRTRDYIKSLLKITPEEFKWKYIYESVKLCSDITNLTKSLNKSSISDKLCTLDKIFNNLDLIEKNIGNNITYRSRSLLYDLRKSINKD